MLGIMHARILARGYVARYACKCASMQARAHPLRRCNGNPKVHPTNSNNRQKSLSNLSYTHTYGKERFGPRFMIVCLT